MQRVVALLRMGVPWKEAWKMSPSKAMAIMVLHGEQNGRGAYDWGKGEFKGEK